MGTRQREDVKHERRNGIQAQPFAIHAALRVADFHCIWLPEPPAADRTREIYRVVPASFSFDRRGNRVGDVPVLALKERLSVDELTVIFGGCYCHQNGPR